MLVCTCIRYAVATNGARDATWTCPGSATPCNQPTENQFRRRAGPHLHKAPDARPTAAMSARCQIVFGNIAPPDLGQNHSLLPHMASRYSHCGKSLRYIRLVAYARG